MPEDLITETRAVRTWTSDSERPSVALPPEQELTLPVNERGRQAGQADLVDVAKLVTAYYAEHPDPGVAGAAGGVRHLRAIAARRCAAASTRTTSWRSPRPSATTAPAQGIDRPALPGRRHARAVGAGASDALEVLAANGVDALVDRARRVHPHARRVAGILRHNRAPAARGRRHRDHPVAQPARRTAVSSTTRRTAARPTRRSPRPIQDRANELLAAGCRGVRRVPLRGGPAGGHRRPVRLPRTSTWPSCQAWSTWTPSAAPGCASGPTRWAAPASAYWATIADRYGLDLTVVNPDRRRHVPVHDAGLGRQDPDGLLVPVRDGLADRPGGRIRRGHRQRHRRRPARHRHPGRRAAEPEPLPGRGHRLPVRAPAGLAGQARRSARRWSASRIIDRVAAAARPRAAEVPVGFKWFVPGLLDGSIGFGGEESAGASFLRADGRSGPPTRTASSWPCSLRRSPRVTGQYPGERYRELDRPSSAPRPTRGSTRPPPRRRRHCWRKLSPEQVDVPELAGEPMLARLTRAPGNQAPLGGIKVITESRLVRGPAVRHRGRLQALRRVVPGP